MEDFSQLCHVLRSEYNARSIPFSLRDYARMCLESLAGLISEERPEQLQSAMAHFFAALCEGNALFNSLPVPSQNKLNSVTIGIPPRRLFELLNDFARVINELSLLEMSSKTVRSSLQENGFPYRSNEFFSLLEQMERIDWSFIKTTGHQEENWTANEETQGRKILKTTPTMTVKTFCRELELSDTIGGQLFHHICGTTPRKRNRN